MAETESGAPAQIEDFYSKVISAIGRITAADIAENLKRQKLTVSVAESLTGGLVSAQLSSVPGSSEYFIGGIVCYSNRIKVMDLGIPAQVIAHDGPVNGEVALLMAENIRKKYRTSIGLSATGVAGPSTVTPPKPIGQTFVALSSENGNMVKELNLSGNREEIREKACQAALGLLWLHLSGQNV